MRRMKNEKIVEKGRRESIEWEREWGIEITKIFSRLIVQGVLRF
jgi:hypothetical protein